MTRILVVEDEPQLRLDLVDYLALAGHEVEGVADAAGFRAALRDLPALVILDVGLPDANGFELAAELRRKHSCGIIILTALGHSEDRIRGFDSGADLYLVKDSPLREIGAAVRSLLRRTEISTTAPPECDRVWRLDGRRWLLISPDETVIQLTASEFAFLRILNLEEGVQLRQTIIDAMARPRTSFDNRHLDSIVNRLRRKIEDRSGSPSPIRVVYGVGYVFTERCFPL